MPIASGGDTSRPQGENIDSLRDKAVQKDGLISQGITGI
jgi:hypothetical protein